MSKLLVIVLIHSCLILKISCYNEVEHMLSDNWLATSDAPQNRHSAHDGVNDIRNDDTELRGNHRDEFDDDDLQHGAYGEDDERLSYQEIPGEDIIDHTHHPMGGYDHPMGGYDHPMGGYDHPMEGYNADAGIATV